MKRNSFKSRGFKRLLAGGLAALTAMAMLAPGMANAGGGAGSGGSGSATGGGGAIKWTYQDSFGAATDSTVTSALQGMGMTVTGSDASTAINQATASAVSECQTRFTQQHPGQGNGDCRLVSVGAIYTPSAVNSFTGNPAGFTSSQWASAWNAETQGKTYSYQGVPYKTTDLFEDGSTTINSLVAREASKDVALIVVVLNQYEPPVDVPPAPPTKAIEQGVSADSMTNQTTISSGTGHMGREFMFSDSFDSHGQPYTISNQKVTDITSGQDISDQFTFDTANGSTPSGDVAHATWKGGNLPNDHSWNWTFDVKVQGPSTSQVDDTGRTYWKGVTKSADQNTPSASFPTWKPAPDKSWVKQDASGNWLAVVDPSHSNATGADNMKFLDGDKVGSVVNGTVDAHLIDTPNGFSLQDDWSKADYLVDPAKASDVKVYEADAQVGTNGHYEQSSINSIVTAGRDVTASFDISINGSKATASAKPAYLSKLKGMATPLQVTMLVPMTVNFANGKGAAQVRKDHNANPGDEVTFCTDNSNTDLTNAGSETINSQQVATNEPKICGYVPPVKKDVVGEASQGGDQASVDGKVVYPGQKVEYQLDTQPRLPADLAYNATRLIFSDQFDQYLNVDKQTLELMDLDTGHTIPKTKYSTKWDDSAHTVTMTVTDPAIIAQWQAAGNPRIQLRFEGTVSKDAPTDHKVNNQWVLTLNNSLTPSNVVFNIPPSLNPIKHDNQSGKQGDPTVSIDGKTLLLGDTGNYVIDLDATQANPAYKVWKLGLVDDFDEQYLKVDPTAITITGDDGRDYTSKFNVQVSDGVLYAFAKRVDTLVPATGETVKGDPQPSDLKAYAASGAYDPLADPAIDQTLLGQHYHLTMPYTVTKVTDGYVVKNQATQIENNVHKDTNQVSNPLKPINPSKDVVVKVGGESVNGSSIYKDGVFLYQLDSSILPPNRAYPTVNNWNIVDKLDPAFDQYTGQWAVYATRDLYKDGHVIADKGSRIAGSGFDSSKFGGDLFTLQSAPDGTLTIAATSAYKALVSTDTSHEQGWRAYIQARRLKVTDRHENRFTETMNDKVNPSNVVWTRTPDMTPSLHIEKWDKQSGWPNGDRDDPKDALTMWNNGETIVFTITNTSNNDGGHGAVYKASDIKLDGADHTVAGDGYVTNLQYPSNWDTLVLHPGEHVDVYGTLQGVTKNHTDRVKVTGTPLVDCPVPAVNPFDGTAEPDPASATSLKRVSVDGRTLCEDTKVDSNQDDWNGQMVPIAATLAQTGSTPLVVMLLTVLLLAAGCGLLIWRRREGVARMASEDAGEPLLIEAGPTGKANTPDMPVLPVPRDFRPLPGETRVPLPQESDGGEAK